MEAINQLEAHIERRCLQIAIKLGANSRRCPRCKHQFAILTEIDININRIRYVIYCQVCMWGIYLLERLPEDPWLQIRNDDPVIGPPTFTT